MQERLNNNIELKTLIDALVNIEDQTYDIQLDENKIILSANKETAEILNNNLNKVLASRNSFQKTRLYKINSGSQDLEDAQETSLEIPPTFPAVLTQENVQSIFFNLFDANEIEESTLISIKSLFNHEASIKNGTFYSRKTNIKAILGIWKNFVEYLIQHFEYASIADIRQAWLGNAHLKPPQNDVTQNINTEKTFAEGLIQQCFGIIFHRNLQNPSQISDASIFFNYPRLYQLIFRPAIHLQPSTTNTQQHEIIINDKEHFFTYLQQLINGDGKLLRIYRNEEEVKMQMLFLSSKPTITKPLLHVIVTDRSGSMYANFKKLKEHLSNLLDELYALDKHADVRLVFFSDIIEIKEFNLTQLQEIKNYINTQEADGDTALYDTITEELKKYRENALSELYNISMVLFTDGKDTCKGNKVAIAQEFEKFQTLKLTAPKCFPMGFGAQYDRSLLEQVAAATGSECHDLKVIDDFQIIYSYLNSLLSDRKLMEIIAYFNEKSQQFNLPIYYENNVTLPNIILPLVDNAAVVSIDNQKLNIQITDPRLIPIANNTDLLRESIQKIQAITATKNLPLKQLITQLGILSQSVKNLQNLTQAETAAQNFILDKINSHINTAEKRLQEEGFTYSIPSKTHLVQQTLDTYSGSEKDSKEEEDKDVHELNKHFIALR